MDRASKGVELFLIKPPVWEEEDGVFAMRGEHFSATVWQVSERWRASVFVAGVCRAVATESIREAKAWCEARYREWVRQFLVPVDLHELLNAMHDTTDKNLARQAAERLQDMAKKERAQ